MYIFNFLILPYFLKETVSKTETDLGLRSKAEVFGTVIKGFQPLLGDQFHKEQRAPSQM